MKIIHLLLLLTTLFFSKISYAVDYYWINGAGNWSDINQWSLISGGPNTIAIPGALDNVIFDANSGLTALDIVNVDVAVDVVNFDYSAVPNAFVFNSAQPNIIIKGNLSANGLVVYTWAGEFWMNSLLLANITSNGTVWGNTFRFAGTGTCTVLDDFSSTSDLYIESGTFAATNISITCNDFYSNTASARTINFTDVTLNLTGTIWELTAPSLIWTSATSVINFTNPGIVSFTGAGQIYDTINVSASEVQIFGDNSVDLMVLASGTQLTLDNGSALTLDSLITNGTCVSPTVIATIDPLLASATIQLSAGLDVTLSNLSINNVDALGPQNYYLQQSDTTNGADNWQYIGSDFYWINGAGLWSDGAHWSLTSGGAPLGCIPTVLDNVHFDNNSNLAAIDVVTLDVMITVNDFDYGLALNPFSFNSALPSIEITGDFTSNGSATFNWAGAIHMRPISNSTFTSNGFIWNNNIHLIGPDTLTLVDNYVSTVDMFIDSGVIIATGINIGLNNFYSTFPSIRSIQFDNTNIYLAGVNWDIDPTTVTFSHTGSSINLQNLGTTLFNGGSLNYDSVHVSSGNLTIFDDNNFALIELISPTAILTLDNGSTQGIDSLVTNGDCIAQTLIQSANPLLASANILKIGSPIFTGFHLTIDNVDALSPGSEIYHISSSDTLNGSDGWLYKGVAYYWIGDAGNWSDVNHWSYSSNGTSAGCIPEIQDSVYFDANSFSSSSQEVLVDMYAFFSYMDWTGSNDPILKLNFDMFSNGDVLMHSNMLVTRDSLERRIDFIGKASFQPDSALIDCNISMSMNIATDSLLLQGYLNMTDSASLYIRIGEFYSLDNSIKCGSIQIIDDSVTAIKLMDLGNSTVTLSGGFNSIGITSNFSFNSGTSAIFIVQDSTSKYLTTEGLTFYNVTLFYPNFILPQEISGSNTFNKLTILKGSYIQIQASSVQTIIDSLIMLGNCRDSIYLTSSIPTTPANFSKTSGNVRAECMDMTGIGGIGGAVFTAYFSTDNNNNTNWVFNATPAVTAGFTVDGPFCFGDTTLFTNTSTSFSGDPADVTSYWYYGDNSTGYYANPPTDSTWINYELDTLQHVFTSFGNYNVTLITEYTNFCVDTITQIVHINYPDLTVNISDSDTSICAGTLLSFDLNSSVSGALYETFLNGISQNTPSLTDTLFQSSTFNHLDTVSFLIYENGCVGPSNPTYIIKVFDLPVVNWTSSDADTTICLNTMVNFTSTGANQYKYFKNGLPLSGFVASGNYSTNTLLNNDQIYVVGKNLATGCLDTTSAMVFTVNPLPTTTLSESIGGNIICVNDTVTFTASGADLYQFLVNGVPATPIGGNTWSVNNLLTGQIVSVMGYTSFGCTKLANETFNYIVNPLPVSNLFISDADTSICSGENVSFSASGGALYEFFINGTSQGAASSVSTLNSATLTHNDQIFVTVGFSGCLQNSDTVIFEVLTAPTTALLSDDADASICAETMVNFTASGATNYQFFVNGVSQGTSSPTNTFSSNTLTNGQTVSVIGESNTCEVIDALVFTVLSLPNVPIFSNDPDNTICFGDPITISSANCANYELFVNGISAGAPQVSQTFNPTLPVGNNSIYIIGTSANGCSKTSTTLNVLVNAIPTVVLTSSDLDNTICSAESVTFTGSGSAQYQFFINGIPQGSMSTTSTLTTTNLSNGQNIQILGSTFGCTSNSNTLTFTVNPIPVVTLTSTDANNIFCEADIETFTASGADDYEFFINAVSQGVASPTNTINSSGFTPGNYTIQVIGTQNNCSATASNTVTVNPLPTASLSSSDVDNIICSGQSVTYTAGTGALYQYQINGVNQGMASPLSQRTFNTLTNGDVVNVIVSTSQGCVANAALAPITVNPSPTVALSSSDVDLDICVNDNVVFTGSGADLYEFFINGVSQGTPTASTTFNTSNLVNNASVTVHGTSTGCTSVSPNLLFTVHNYPIVTLTNSGGNEVCVGENTNLLAVGANNYQFLVNGIPTGPFSLTNTYTSPVNNGDVISVSGETFGCVSSSSASITFTVYTYPTITSTSSDADNIICLNDLVTFSSTGASTYNFSINASLQQSGATNTFSTSNIQNGDLISVVGLNGDCASAPSNFNFTVNSMNLDLSVSASNLICSGENVTFTATGADLYVFFVNGISQGALSPTATFTSGTLTDLDEVTYTGYSTTTMCTQPYQDYIVMNVLDQPAISNATSLTICEGDSVLLMSSYSFGNQWYLDGNPILGATDTSYVAYTSGAYSLESTAGGNGTMWSFGLNAQGMFGNGSNLNNTEPTLAQTTQIFDEISSGAEFMLGVTTTGAVYAWGENSSGQLGNGTYTNSNVPITVPTLANIKTVASTETSSMATTNTGAVYVWGNNTLGQLGTGNTAVINFPFQNTNLANTDSIAGGKNHFVALKNDGTVWTVGDNAYGQLGQGNLLNSMTPVQVAGLTNIVSVGAGEYHSFAINSAGDLYVWGNNGSGQLGLNDITNRLTPALSPLKNIINAQGGANHSMFLSSNEKVFTSGGNVYGQLGTGNFSSSLTPVQTTITGAKMISAGQYTSLVKRADNSVFGFGNNLEGQLSSPNGNSINTPEHIQDLYGVAFIEAGKSSSHFLYNESQSCVSTATTVTMLTVPPVTITAVGAVLTATSGTAYQWYFNGNEIPGATNQTWTALSNGIYTVAVTFANGCTGMSTQFPYGVNGMDELTKSFEVYPNPTSGMLNVIVSGEISGNDLIIEVRDMAGRIVMQQTAFETESVQLDLSGLVTGVYIVEVQTKNKTIGRKQIVKSN